MGRYEICSEHLRMYSADSAIEAVEIAREQWRLPIPFAMGDRPRMLRVLDSLDNHRECFRIEGNRNASGQWFKKHETSPTLPDTIPTGEAGDF